MASRILFCILIAFPENNVERLLSRGKFQVTFILYGAVAVGIAATI